MSYFLNIKRELKKYVKYTYGLIRSFYWTRFTSNKVSSGSFTAHILIVEKIVYVALAKVCAESFLFFHPNAKIIFHVDTLTEPLLKKKLRHLVKHKNVNVQVLSKSPKLTWQNRKLSIIFKINGTSDIFLDADLKFNGPLPNVSGVTFFVKEFKMSDDFRYARLLSLFNTADYENASMYNTSFFTFGSHLQKNLELSEFFSLQQKVIDLVRSLEIDPVEIGNMERISEQIALSLIVGKWNTPIHSLKEVDGHKDKSFLESSYYGATESTF
jgi:hypothetical protein